MWYRASYFEQPANVLKVKIIDEATKAEWRGTRAFSCSTKENSYKTLEEVVRAFPEDYSDGMVLDEVIKLIDTGECDV